MGGDDEVVHEPLRHAATPHSIVREDSVDPVASSDTWTFCGARLQHRPIHLDGGDTKVASQQNELAAD